MNYYDEIKEQIINNEITRKIKDYSKNKSDLNTYYNVGKLLAEAGKHYGEGIIKEYSIKLTSDLGKKYTSRTLRRFRQFYNLCVEAKWSTLSTKLSWSHYAELIVINNFNAINYYITICECDNLSVRQLREKIKNNEYERLDENIKLKLSNKGEYKIDDFVKNPILIKNSYNYDYISEKLLKKLILEDLDNFMKELGSDFSYIANEYKIKLGDRYNYIDLLFYNIKYNCYVVVELKVVEIKSEHIGQIQKYMNYIDKNIKNINQDKTIGIIICKKENKFVMEYCSDDRILSREYVIY